MTETRQTIDEQLEATRYSDDDNEVTLLAKGLQRDTLETAQQLLDAAESLIRDLKRDVIEPLQRGHLDRVSSLFGTSSLLTEVCHGCTLLDAKRRAAHTAQRCATILEASGALGPRDRS